MCGVDALLEHVALLFGSDKGFPKTLADIISLESILTAFQNSGNLQTSILHNRILQTDAFVC